MLFFNHSSIISIGLLAFLTIFSPLILIAQEERSVPSELLFQTLRPIENSIISKKIAISGKVELIAPPFNIYRFIAEDKSARLQDIFTVLSKVPEINIVQHNHALSLRGVLPNDSLFGEQWSLQNTGQKNGLLNADIEVTDAWEKSQGGVTKLNDTIVIAVIDNGFELDHPDLKFWKNKDEIPFNNIDDDNNGYIDDVEGWNAYSQNGTITTAWHGTHVSGIIAALGNNNFGISGINWNTSLMPIQGSTTTESTVIAAYSYVFSMKKKYLESNGSSGAFIVASNSSFGIDYGRPSNFPLWCSIYDSLGAVGILSATATANASINVDTEGDIPTTCQSNYLITVTNTTNRDTKHDAAAFGPINIDLGAPGTEIISTIPGKSFGYDQGTSMATPHVTGALGLMYANACKELLEDYKHFPDSVSMLMKSFLLNSTDPLSDLKGKTVSGGRLNVNKALLVLNEFCLSIPFRREYQKNKSLKIHKVFPVPVQGDNLIIHLSSAREEKIELNLLDNLGRIVLYKEYNTSFVGFNEIYLHVSTLASGLYFIRAKQGNDSSDPFKIIIQ